MATLTKAHRELFTRTPDECFETFDDLYEHCDRRLRESEVLWEPPDRVVVTHDLTVCDSNEGTERRLTDWSFSQICRMAGVRKDTVNRLSTKTASMVLEETLPRSGRPLQVLTTGDDIRSVHGVAYTRLWNRELLDVVRECAGDFRPPQRAMGGQNTGLYCGEQDMFAFLIDPSGWVEIKGEAFAPGMFVWNSEVGRRSLGIQTFWFQRICQNHIVWDATEVVDYSRKHTANVHEGLNDIRAIIDSLVAKRDERRDSFAIVMRKAMTERLGDDKEDAAKSLVAEGLPARLVDEALDVAYQQGGFTIFSIVDALTKLSQKVCFAGDRTELDVRIGRLMNLALAA